MTAGKNPVSPVRLLVMEGDGIGPDITAATLLVLGAIARRFGLTFAFEHAAIGFAAFEARAARPFRMPPLRAARPADGVILGPVSHNEYPPRSEGGLNPSGELRKRLDLYRQYPPGALARRLPAALRLAGRSRDRPREHRRLLRRPLMFLGPGEFMPTPDLALVGPQGDARRLDAHRRGRLPPRAAAPPQGHRRSQGQRAARLRRPVPRMRARRSPARYPRCRL